MDGLRSCIRADNCSAVDVSHDRFTSRSRISVRITQRRPSGKVHNDSTLRAEEVGTLQAFINIDHIDDDRWRPPLVDGGLACLLPSNLLRKLKGKNGKRCTVTTEICTRQQEPKSQVRVKKRKPVGQ